MIKWLGSFLLLFISVNCLAIENYKVGDSLTVYINSGLKLRQKPSSKSDALTTIPIGKKVFIKKQLLREFKHQDSFASMRLLKGYWVLVEYKGQLGYVFDGYLSSLPYPVIFKNKPDEKKGYSTEEYYLFTHFAKTGSAFDTTLIPEEYGNYHQYPTPYSKYQKYSLKFSNGITYSKIEHLEIGGTDVMKFENHSLDEILLLAKAVIDTYSDKYTTNKFIYNKQHNVYMMGAVGEAGCSVDIYEKDGVVYWSKYCGC